MAKFCSDECKETGSICDFCNHYKDEYRDIKKIIDIEGNLRFAGVGICDIDNSETDAISGYNCDNFECFMIKE
jgi:hypothetical protein